MIVTALDSKASLRVFLDDVLNNPRAHLTSSEITHLRKLDAAGVAMKARNGWVCQGTFYKDKTFRRFIVLNLVDEDFGYGRHTIRLNPRGRTVIALLAERRPKAG